MLINLKYMTLTIHRTLLWRIENGAWKPVWDEADRRQILVRAWIHTSELLVVVGIIALLIGILLPALNRARQASQETQCMSNLRQWGIGLQMYCDNNRGLLPYKGGKGIDSGTDLIGPANSMSGFDDTSVWWNSIPAAVTNNSYYQMMVADKQGLSPLPTGNANSIFTCPSGDVVGSLDTTVSTKGYDAFGPNNASFLLWGVDGSGVIGSKTVPFQQKFFLSYGYNSQLLSTSLFSMPKTTPIKIARFGGKAAVIPIIIEKIMNPAEYTNRSVQSYAISHANLGTNITAKGYTSDISQPLVDLKRFTARHNGGGNILFCDGHVDFLTWVQAQGNSPTTGSTYNINTASLMWCPFGVDDY